MTPIERAAQAMADDWNPDRDPVLTAMFRDYAASALASINTNDLAKALAQDIFCAHCHDNGKFEDDEDGPCPDCHKVRKHIAQAVKNWLTGKDQQ